MSARTDLSLWRGLWPFLQGWGRLWVGAMVLAPATAIAAVLQPWLLRWAIDEHLVHGDVGGVIGAAWLYLGVVAVGFACQVGHTALVSVAATRTITDLRRAAFRHLLGQRAAFFDAQPTGRLLTRVTNDIEALGETLNAGAFTVVVDALQVLGVLAAMLWLDWRLTCVLIFVGPPLALFIEVLRRRLRELFNETHTTLATLNAWTAERLEGVETIQLTADEDRARGEHDVRLAAYRDATVRTNLYDALLFATVDGVSAVSTALILYYASGGVLGAVTTPGTVAAFIDYLGKLFTPVQEFSQKVAVIQRATAALEKVFSLLDAPERIHGGSVELTAPRGHLRVRGVRFAYEPGRPVLDGVDLDLAPGEVVALCGRTGSGKSTIGGLLTRTYDGYEGSITLDGHELHDLTVDSARRAIAAVRQEPQLLPDTIRFNLTLGRPVPDDRLWEVLGWMRADDVVRRLGGLDALVEASGRNLSGGEAQLLTLARTLLAGPAVVVLDEATASVDPLTEARVQTAIDAILARTTTLVIAHRLSTVLHADRIVLLDQGRVLEVGDHHTLMAADGPYARLFRQQFHEASLHDGPATAAPPVTEDRSASDAPSRPSSP